MKRIGSIVICSALLLAGSTGVFGAQEDATPPTLVATYDSLADAILAVKKTEWNLVHTILATTYKHAESTMDMLRSGIRNGEDVRADIEKLAALVSQLGNEGDAAVAAVRKRLVEAGHHHHASGAEKGMYDEGFVIVTREARKGFLDAANRIGKLAAKPDLTALENEWSSVRKQFEGLHAGIGRR